MTAPPATATALSAREFLLGDHDAGMDDLARSLSNDRVLGTLGAALGRLSNGAGRVLGRRFAEVAADLVDIDVGGVVLGGWRKYTTLAAAAGRTLDAPRGKGGLSPPATPGSEELVDLATHRITSVHRPELEVLVDDVPVGSVTLELRLDLLIRALVAIVRDGRLVALEGGRCLLSAQLSCLDLTVAERDSEFDLGAVIDLGEGIPLIPVERHTPAR